MYLPSPFGLIIQILLLADTISEDTIIAGTISAVMPLISKNNVNGVKRFQPLTANRICTPLAWGAHA